MELAKNVKKREERMDREATTNDSSDGEDTSTGVEESATPAAPAVAAAPQITAMSLLEREGLQAIRIIHGSKPPGRHQGLRACPCQSRRSCPRERPA